MTAFVLFSPDNDSYAFRKRGEYVDRQPEIEKALTPDMSGAPFPNVKRCAHCGEMLDKWNEPLNRLRIVRRQYDLSGTYDGLDVVSKGFRCVYEAKRLVGLTFIQLPGAGDFFAIQARRTVSFDAERRGTRFVKPCSECGHYQSVVGATPVFLKNSAVIGEREFVRTDLEFGSYDGKSPLLLCGEGAASVLVSAGLSGVELEKVEA